jgi:hypothetical protein
VMSSSIAAMPVDGHDFTEMATPIAGNDHLIVELMSSPRPMPKRPPDGRPPPRHGPARWPDK